MEINPRYKIWVTSEYEIPVITFIKEHKISGYMYPNLRHGVLFDVYMPEDMIVIMKLTIPCQIEKQNKDSVLEVSEC